MNESVLNKTPQGFEIREVTDETQLNDFKGVFVETYEIPEWAGQAWVDATRRMGIGKTFWRMFVGYLDGKPVATNSSSTAVVSPASTLWRHCPLHREKASARRSHSNR